MVDHHKNGATPLMATAQFGHLDVVEWLVTKGNADPNLGNTVWSTILPNPDFLGYVP